MRCRPFTAVAAIPLVAALMSGCTSQGLSENNAPTPETAPSPSTADCVVVAEPPGLAAWEVNEGLPIDGVDVAYTQSELLIEPGGGSCDAGPAEVIVDPCIPVSGPYDQVQEIHLWRHADAFFEQEFASGAQRILSENFDGYTEDGAAYHWRALAIEYDDTEDAWTSPAWGAIEGCKALKRDELQTGVVSLSQGEEPFLAATIAGSTVYIVETWLASDDEHRLDDTATGLVPDDGVRMIMAWLKGQMRHL